MTGNALARFARVQAGGVVARAAVPDLPWDDFAEALIAAVAHNARVVAYFGAAEKPAVRLYLLLAGDAGDLLAATTRVTGNGFPALTPRCPQVHLFEREIAEQHGLQPEGHPWLRAVRFPPPQDRDGGEGSPPAPAPGVIDFYRVGGDEVHEVGVGPVHAGVIEPGHFRFQCHGEEVFHLEISLGYQHRGVERALLGGPGRRSVHYLETAAGDTTVGHATAYCEIVEALAGTPPPARGSALRAVALELERLANHVGDLGALAGDVGYLPTASYCGRIRGDFLNATAELCGSRFGRGLVRPGGTPFAVDEALVSELLARLQRAEADCKSAVELLWASSSVMTRFEGTGAVARQAAEALGLVGPAARASGLDRDVRRDHPTGSFRSRQVPVALGEGGDVFARAHVRWLEIQRSLTFVREELAALPAGPTSAANAAGADRRLAPRQLAASLVEGWRGEVCHVALTGEDGRFERYKVIDPSFHNWAGLALAMRGQQISDFPLCNKSFNLSYCGHDL